MEIVYDQAPVGIDKADLAGRFLRVNNRLCEITGYDRAELLTLALPDITHPDDLAREEATHGELLRGEITRYTLEKRHLRKDGAIMWVQTSRALVSDYHGRPQHLIGQRLPSAVSAGRIGIYDWHLPSGRVVWPEQQERLYGLAPGTYTGEIAEFGRFLLPADKDAARQPLADALARREPVFHFAHRIRRASDGAIRWIEGSALIVYGPGGAPERLIGVNLDTTERRAAPTKTCSSLPGPRVMTCRSPCGWWRCTRSGWNGTSAPGWTPRAVSTWVTPATALSACSA